MIYLMRHGLDDERYIGGWSDVGLIDEGVTQIKNTLKKMQELKIDIDIKKIYSSDVVRARQTAELLNLKKEIVFTSKLREQNKGDLNGMDVKEAKDKYREIYDENKLTCDFKYPNGESLVDLYQRIIVLLNSEIIKDNNLLITHRGVINMFYYYFNNQSLDMNKKQFGVTHASVHEIDLEKRLIKKII